MVNAGYGRDSQASATGAGYEVPPPSSVPAYHYWKAGRKANGMFLDRVLPNQWKTVVRSNELEMSTSDIKDGGSNTLMLSENLLAGNWNLTTPWYLGQSGTGGPYFPPTGFVWLYAVDKNPPANPSTLNPVPRDLPPHAKINGMKRTATTLANIEYCRPSSNHSGGVNVGFVSGDVRFLSEEIDYNVYQHLCTPDSKNSDVPFKMYLLKAADY